MLKVADIRHTRAYEQLCLYAIACGMNRYQKGQLVKKFLKHTPDRVVGTFYKDFRVIDAFSWAASPEGWGYWNEINKY